MAVQKNDLYLISERANTWFHEFYPQSNDDLFKESDFNEMKKKADEILKNSKDKEPDPTDLTWAKSEPNLCRGRVNNMLVDYSGLLKGSMDKVVSPEAADKYASVKALSEFKTVSNKWTYIQKSLMTVKYTREDENSVPKAEVDEVSVYVAKQKAGSLNDSLECCNVLLVQEYGAAIQYEISWCDAKVSANQTIEKANTALTTYFEEGSEEDSEYLKVQNALKSCRSALEASNEDASRLDTLNARVANLQYVLDMLDVTWDNKRQALYKEIVQAQNLLTWLSVDEKHQTSNNHYKTLAVAIDMALGQYNKGQNDLVLAHFTKAQQSLNVVYSECDRYYTGLVEKLNECISNAETSNSTWKDANLTKAIATARESYAKAVKRVLFDTKIQEATTELQQATKLAEVRFKAKAAVKELDSYIKLYGDDKDGSLADLKERAANVTVENADALWEQIETKKKEFENSYEESKEKLTKLIENSETYFNKWSDKEGMQELKTAYIAAEKVLTENTTEACRNIKALNDAYDSLYNIYDKAGGNSDPAQYAKQLEEVLAQATEVQNKYNYYSLGQVIKEASTYRGSNKTHELQAQIRSLKAEMERTKVQYQSLVNRSDEILVEVQSVLDKRYMDSIPETYKQAMQAATDSLQVAPEQPDGIERVCTNMEVAMQQQQQVANIAVETENKWKASVDILSNGINDAALKYEQTYPGVKKLEEAILKAQDQLRTIKEAEANPEKAQPEHRTIAFAEKASADLENVVADLESNDRRNMANNYIREYDKLQDNFEKYGSDEESVPTSNAKAYLEKNKALYDELSELGKIQHTMNELNELYSQIVSVNAVYQLFCDAAKLLDNQIVDAEKENTKYYNDAEGTGLDKTLKKARLVRSSSFSLDSVQTYTNVLRDSVMGTIRSYNEHYLELRSSRSFAMNCHIKYYGEEVENSEIKDVYKEAEAYVGTEGESSSVITNIFSMEAMTQKLDTCYKHAEDSCAVLGDKLQILINRSDTLNVLMEDGDFSNKIAGAVNAKYAPKARISAIISEQIKLQGLYDGQLEKYQEIVAELRNIVVRARAVQETTGDAELKKLIEQAEVLLLNVDPEKNRSEKYRVLSENAQALSDLADTCESQWNQALSVLLKDLSEAREKALQMHNLYYGKAAKESEILEVYNRSARYLESDDVEGIKGITKELKNSYMEASIENSKREANLKSLIAKTTPLATLMEDKSITSQINKSNEALQATDARIATLQKAEDALQPVYDTNATDYDQAVMTLGDTIQVAKDLLMQVRDDALQQAIYKAEEAYIAADKTEEEATKYADLKMNAEKLAEENARVRDIIITGIEDIDADDEEVVVYSIQGIPMKRVNLSDKDCLNDLPAGIYIVKGKKVIID